jgi:hypothetical protein
LRMKRADSSPPPSSCATIINTLQEENIYLTCPLEKIRQYPIEVQKRPGYDLSHPFLGYVGLQTPLNMLHPDMQFNGDLFS